MAAPPVTTHPILVKCTRWEWTAFGTVDIVLVQWCHLQLKATLFFLQSPVFSMCYHYIIPPSNKEQQILTCLLYSPYMLDLYPLPTVNSTCSRFHCTCRYREGGPGPLGDLVSCRLMLPSGNPGIFLFAQHYVCLPVSGGDMTAGRLPGQDNCPRP